MCAYINLIAIVILQVYNYFAQLIHFKYRFIILKECVATAMLQSICMFVQVIAGKSIFQTALSSYKGC